MATTPSSILVFGGTGLIGKFIVKALIETISSFERVGIFTSLGTLESKGAEIQKLKDRGVQVVVGDLSNDADVFAAYKGKFSTSLEDRDGMK
jgi:uncharacterized protein YbjT (DUF2867 family)